MARQDRAIRTRRSILEAAAQVFGERGYASATVEQILNHAGVTRGALYFHFSSKEEVALGVLEAQMPTDRLPERSSKLQKLVDHGMVMAYRLQHDPLVQAGVSLALDQGARELDRNSAFRAWSDQLERILAEARGQGELLPHIDVTDTAELLTGAFSGVQAMSQARCNRADLGHRVSVLLRHVLPSISTPAMLAALDLSPERGERVFQEYRESSSEAAAPAATVTRS
ncbi:ScbR family autoregulator-binding transcription factor [Streptomyces sp. AS02]|uniref:ScbR family autoregulator-binding transcription factor n=1 Tax=Streptomyces sp. AS02 TaxID=2938946 RepID=UPI002020B474|nr:ScbR family autoregulator-binding transcription factor [Streptomyces sp. AS02]MCL8017856.1 TetR family transcriptional regulator [Streptomyces sp. AS02]